MWACTRGILRGYWKFVKNAPTGSVHETNQSLIYLSDAIRKHREDQVNECHRILTNMKKTTVQSPQKGQKRAHSEGQDENDGSCSQLEEQEDPEWGTIESEGMPVQPPPKRRRRTPAPRITCAVKGCDKSHVRSGKWAICEKCNKNFCLLHAEMKDHHKC